MRCRERAGPLQLARRARPLGLGLALVVLAGASCEPPDPEGCSPPFTADGPIVLEHPRARFVYQQRGGVADLRVRGRYTGPWPGAVVARWGEGPWQLVDAALGPEGAFDGVLPARSIGRATLEVRLVTDWDARAEVPDVGVGNVVVLAGQSNIVGYFQGRSVSRLGASVLTQRRAPLDPDGVIPAADPIHDCEHVHGSLWPRLGDRLVAGTGAPLMFVAAGIGGTGLVVPADWAPGAWAYRQLIEQIERGTAGQRCPAAMLWMQGESDAVNAVPAGVYADALGAFAAAFEAEMACDVPIVVGVIGRVESHPWVEDPAHGEAIRQAQRVASLLGPHLRPGPETDDLALVNLHYVDADVPVLLDRWCAALPPASGLVCGPEPEEP